MSNYTKAADFALKDALPTTDSLKIVKGAEIDNEFNLIQTAITSKADILSPALEGTPTAPTAAPGTDTVQIATTAFVIDERSTAATISNKTLSSCVLDSVTVPDEATATTLREELGTQDAANLTEGIVDPARLGSGTADASVVLNGANQWVSIPLLGADQTWQNVIGSRAFGNSYQNTTGRTIFVNAWQTPTSGSTGLTLAVSSNNSTWITIDYQYSIYNDDQNGANVGGPIPPGMYYRVTSNTTSGSKGWAELR
jgi:hypothetical protein